MTGLNQDLSKSVKHPDSYTEVSVHPVTKKRGRFAVRSGRPVEVWDRKQHRMKWIRQVEVEELPLLPDDPVVVVIAAGGMSVNDFKEVSEEMADSRIKRRRNSPVLAPKAAYIEEACREIRIRGEEQWTVGNQIFRRPSQGLLIPRNAEWALAMAAESRRNTL